MAFLKNDADIILDAVLTDVGRERLARGDGSFRITKFALADDEINYQLHDNTAGTSFQDLNIAKTPILEAMTNSYLSKKNYLFSLSGRDDNLYLPILKLNTNASSDRAPGKAFATGDNSETYVVACTDTVVDTKYSGALPTGFIDGRSARKAGLNNQLIRIEQGIDSEDFNADSDFMLENDLTELIFHIYLDGRFGKLVTSEQQDAEMVTRVSSENNIDHYVVTIRAEEFFHQIEESSTEKSASILKGPRNDKQLVLGVRATRSLTNSSFLFDKFGRTMTNFFTDSTSAKVIDTTMRVMGNDFGYSVEIPLRFIKES